MILMLFDASPMKNIHVSQLKAPSFNLDSLIEESVEIQEDNVRRTYK